MRILKVEIADTPTKQHDGLMFRKELADDAGMAFKFGNPQTLNFWGLNTYIPLDIAFVSPENKIIKIDYIKPMSMHTVTSDGDCLYAIEANVGYFAENDVVVGDEVSFDEDNDGFPVVVFKKIVEGK